MAEDKGTERPIIKVDTDAAIEHGKGLVRLLLDFSFRDFVTPKLVKVLYGLGLIISILGALAFLYKGFDNIFRGEWASGLLMVLGTPVVLVLYVILTRVCLETAVVLFRMNDNLQKLADKPSTDSKA